LAGWARLSATPTVLARWQPQTDPLLQPIEQEPNGHVAQLPMVVAPVPELCQPNRQSAAALAAALVDPRLEPG
jgi:hypothetical protein